MSTSIQWWPARPIDENSFADILPNHPVESINWQIDPNTGQAVANMIVTFGGEPLTTMQRYLAIRRMRTTPPQEQRETAAVDAYKAIDQYVNLGRTPLNGEVLAQVLLQAKVLRELIKNEFPIATEQLLGQPPA